MPLNRSLTRVLLNGSIGRVCVLCPRVCIKFSHRCLGSFYFKPQTHMIIIGRKLLRIVLGGSA